MKAMDVANGILAVLTAVALMVLAVPARAEGQGCAPRETVVERLSTRFNETRRGIGLRGGDRVLEVWASEAAGSWTVTVTMPDGRTCVMASGQAWEDRMDDLAHLADTPA
jgi:hypothetical protein